MITITPYVLTPEQREELIALCNKTFPELTFSFWFDRDANDNHGIDDDYPISDYLGFGDLRIHWFEFVVRMILDLEDDPGSTFEQFFDKVRACE